MIKYCKQVAETLKGKVPGNKNNIPQFKEGFVISENETSRAFEHVIIYYMFVMRDVEYIAQKWGIPVSMMLSFLFVPQTTVWVHDDVSKPQCGISQKIRSRTNGAGTMPQCGASQVRKIGKALTFAVERAFSLPDDLKYNKAGMVFGSDILEKAKEFKIVNQNCRENVKNFVGQCMKYDIMLNNKYICDQQRDSNNLFGSWYRAIHRKCAVCFGYRLKEVGRHILRAMVQ